MRGWVYKLNTEKFTGKAQVYANARPGYAPALYDYLYNEAGFSAASIIAETGSGTGKFSLPLLQRGSTVYCIEPNADMRSQAEAMLSAYPNFISINAPAEDTALADASVDFVAAAQAFHWFDAVRFKQECARILRRGGKPLLVWNTRQSCPLHDDLQEIYNKYCPNFKGLSGRRESTPSNIAYLFDDDFTYKTFEHNLTNDEDEFVSRSLSASYSLMPSDCGFDEYRSALVSLFLKYASDDIVLIPNVSELYIGNQ